MEDNKLKKVLVLMLLTTILFTGCGNKDTSASNNTEDKIENTDSKEDVNTTEQNPDSTEEIKNANYLTQLADITPDQEQELTQKVIDLVNESSIIKESNITKIEISRGMITEDDDKLKFEYLFEIEGNQVGFLQVKSGIDTDLKTIKIEDLTEENLFITEYEKDKNNWNVETFFIDDILINKSNNIEFKQIYGEDISINIVSEELIETDMIFIGKKENESRNKDSYDYKIKMPGNTTVSSFSYYNEENQTELLGELGFGLTSFYNVINDFISNYNVWFLDSISFDNYSFGTYSSDNNAGSLTFTSEFETLEYLEYYEREIVTAKTGEKIYIEEHEKNYLSLYLPVNDELCITLTIDNPNVDEINKQEIVDFFIDSIVINE